MMQALKSRTMIFAILLAVLGTVQASAEVFSAWLTPQAYGIFTLVVGVAVAVLRVLTTEPLLPKDK